jgi:hypothetical protein
MGRVCWAAPAAAAEPPDPDPPSYWYGGQTLIADGIALGLWVTSGVMVALDDDVISQPIGALGSLTFLVVPPIIHFEHAQTGKGLASLGLRLALPVAAILFVYATSDGCHEALCEVPIASVGLALLLSPILIDALIAYAPLPVVQPTPSTSLTPMFTLVGGAPRFGLRGEF